MTSPSGPTAITNVRVFTGTDVHDAQTVLIHDGRISAIGATTSAVVPAEASVIDGNGHTLLPGLIDAHVHTQEKQLGLALQFGITTELEMAGHWTSQRREAVAANDTLADVRTADFGMTAPGGHPMELHKRIPPEMFRDSGIPDPVSPASKGAGPKHDHPHPPPPPPGIRPPTVVTAAEATTFVADRVASGADYIKFMIEEGTVVAEPGLPLLPPDVLEAGVTAAHAHGKLAIAHAMTLESTTQALNAGMDGIAHLFVDGLATKELIALFKERKAFVTACAGLNASFMNIRASTLLDDPRVTSRLPQEWLDALNGTFNCYPEGKMEHVLGSIKALHDAGIDILVGTDASVPSPQLGGLAHGASVHHELQLFVEAGLTPIQALEAATSVTARRFHLDDRGRVAEGLRADLLLVEGNPTVNIKDTLNIKGIWRRGVRLQS